MRVHRRPSFVPGQHGALFVLEMLPHDPVSDWGVVLLAPFAEEMNRCRRMLVLQAESFARAGVRSLLFDYYGTGDSEGDFGAASIETWRADALRAAELLCSSGCRAITWLGVRFGGLLALDVAPKCAASRGIVLWEPLVSGKQIVKHQLRVLNAASMLTMNRQSSIDPRAELESGRSVEIAGYEISPRLVRGLEALSLDARTCRELPVAWYEIGVEASPDVSAGSRRIADSWRSGGVQLEVESIRGDPFWSTTEVTVAPPLIERSTALVLRWASRV
jgi:exosortase A-associated hydrolase 2